MLDQSYKSSKHKLAFDNPNDAQRSFLRPINSDDKDMLTLI